MQIDNWLKIGWSEELNFGSKKESKKRKKTNTLNEQLNGHTADWSTFLHINSKYKHIIFSILNEYLSILKYISIKKATTFRILLKCLLKPTPFVIHFTLYHFISIVSSPQSSQHSHLIRTLHSTSRSLDWSFVTLQLTHSLMINNALNQVEFYLSFFIHSFIFIFYFVSYAPTK